MAGRPVITGRKDSRSPLEWIARDRVVLPGAAPLIVRVTGRAAGYTEGDTVDRRSKGDTGGMYAGVA